MFSRAYSQEIQGYFEERMALLQHRQKELQEAGEFSSGERPERKASTGRTDPEGTFSEGVSSRHTVPGKELYVCSVALLRQKQEEIKETLQQCTQEEREALWFLYSASPLSDMLDYPAALFLAYAKHGVFLWNEGPYAGRVPEKVFANYVLHHRVHNEDLADTRRFFYEQLRQRTAGMEMYDAAVEANYWCGEHATYQSTYLRTQNPLTMYGTAAGRCGEEAPFAATALRSIGIPAREVYAPWWAHCDDNHAWIEAWCDGKWYFTGGCEPEPRLNEGWFAGPCSRAMLVSSRWFGKDAPIEPVVGHNDLSVALNHMGQYAPSTCLTVRVVDEQGRPVPGAKVEFCLLNYGSFRTCATLTTGTDPEEDCGVVRLDTGYGSLLVCASQKGCYGETMAELAGTKEAVTCTVVLKERLSHLGEWRKMSLLAPREAVRDETKTQEQAAKEAARALQTAGLRQKRAEGFYQEREADRVLMRFAGTDREKIREILQQAKGNMGEIVRFLEWDFAGQTMPLEQQYGRETWKRKVLEVLSANEYWDIKAEVLADCSICAAPYAGSVPEKVFFEALLNPCMGFERARAHRRALRDCLKEDTRQALRRDPGCVTAILGKLVKTYPEEEYANLVTSSLGCLTGGMASAFSRKVLCVNLLRAVGIPARIGGLARALEYYAKDGFVTVAQEEGTEEDTHTLSGTLILRTGENLKITDWKHYSLCRFQRGHFEPLFLGAMHPGRSRENGMEDTEDCLEVSLETGIYRIVTTNRLPNGSQHVRLYDFALEGGEKKDITLSMHRISAEDILERMPVEDFALTDGEGRQVQIASLAEGKRALLLWLDLSREPSQHILNELYEKRESYGKIPGPIYFVVPTRSGYREDVTLCRTCQGLPRIRMLFGDFGEKYRQFARQVGRNPGKLPLAVVLEDHAICVYSDAGYNVGMADTLLQIVR